MQIGQVVKNDLSNSILIPENQLFLGKGASHEEILL